MEIEEKGRRKDGDGDGDENKIGGGWMNGGKRKKRKKGKKGRN